MYVRYTGGGPGHYPLENVDEHGEIPEEDEPDCNLATSPLLPEAGGIEGSDSSQSEDDSEDDDEADDDDDVGANDDGDIQPDEEAEGFGAL